MASAARSVFRAEPYEYAAARRIAASLELAEPIAVMLVRRGYTGVEEARAFMEARDEHDPGQFEGMDDACALILGHARRGAHVTIHGDYDVDGVCSTAILVATLRELGARCDWLIPDRMGEGYGLSEASVAELRRRGTELVITVDCGITAAEEVGALRGAGVDVVVTDHHEPPADLPGCPILHPVVSGYPFSGLCAAGVAHKLSLALRRAAGLPGDGRGELDLVALATVADLVPLIGENRRMVRQGLAQMRSAPRPGLRALMAASRTDPESVDEQALGFRLAPRINAAGRLYRADAGVELMLTGDGARAEAIAEELDRANSERRGAEREVAEAAERARRELPPELADAPALVLAGEGWHPGVVGISASRLAERHWRPVLLLSVEGERARGSARSIPGFDLISALDACSEHLVRHGGHRAAAGLELEAGRVEAFREAFLAVARERIGEAELTRTESVDALVGVGREGIGMELATQLERLGPFGQGNPDPRLIVPSARLRTIRPLGREGKHSRFDLESGTGRAAGVAFGMNGEITGREGEALDLSVRLEVDRWNGALQPRVVLRELYSVEAELGEPECAAGSCPSADGVWWERLEAELAREPEGWPPALGRRPSGPGPSREVVDRRRGAAVAAVAELVSSGESVLALCADASRRRALAGTAADPRRFGAPDPLIVCGRCGDPGLDAALGAGDRPAGPGLVLADWAALARRPEAPRRFHHVVLIDPPPFERVEQLARAGQAAPGGRPAAASPGFLHLAWGRSELELAERCLGFEWQLRGAVTQVWRVLSKHGGEAEGERLRELLAGPGRHSRTPEVAARCVAVLSELGLCEWRPDRAAPRLGVLSSKETKLERSRAYVACAARHTEGLRYLRERAQPSG
ncbi:MAG: single-stranded-DNA-specific exonuclease RecJ [Solirubrobacterales bacterium]